jgi:hypothetical protein
LASGAGAGVGGADLSLAALPLLASNPWNCTLAKLQQMSREVKMDIQSYAELHLELLEQQ